MSKGYSVIAPPEVLETLATTNTPWPGYEGDLDSLRRQGAVEQTFFQDGATINFAKIPSVQFWAPLVGYTKNDHVKFVVTTLMQVAQTARRPLTPKEIEITSDFAALSSRWFPLNTLGTISTSAAFTFMGYRTYKFPFYTPRVDSFNPLVFPKKTYPLLKGPSAMFAWHSVRFSLYFAICYMAFAPIGSSLATLSFDARLLRDPRLRALQVDIKNSFMEKRAEAMNSQQGPGMRVPRPPQSPRVQDVPKSEDQARSDYGRDTYNEQSGNGFNEPAAGPSEDTTPTPQPSWSQNTPSPASPSNVRGAKFPDPGSRYVNDSDPFDDDDGSPVPASVRRAEAQRAHSAQGGSMWDRIRQQSQPTNSSGQQGSWAQLRQDKTPNPREVQPKTEGFAYTKQDEDKERRNYEREQAQKEFDALLESERRGGSNKR